MVVNSSDSTTQGQHRLMENHKGSGHGWPRSHPVKTLKHLTKPLMVVIMMTTGCAAVGTTRPQPVIEKLTGTTELGKVLVLNGSQFTETEHGIVISDTGDSINMLQAGKMSELEPDQLWNKRGSPWAKPLERTRDNKTGSSGYLGKGKSYNGYLKPLKDSKNTRLFVSWRFKPSESPGHSKGSNKFIRIWDKTNGKGTRISWTQMHLTYPGSEKPSWGGWPGKSGQWNQMSLWVDGDKGAIKAWVNEKLAHNITNFKKKDKEKGLNIKLIGFDPNRSTPYKDMDIGIDDLYVSSTQARVVVSDKADWTQASSRQSVQIPTSWSDNQIRFVYQPSDYLGEKHYLYVVNKHGDANTKGFPISGASMPAPEDQPE